MKETDPSVRDKKPTVLLVSLAYYPSAAIGAHRAGKFVKYLPSFGWNPVVLTIREEFYREISPGIDLALTQQIPPEAQVLRSGYLEPRRLRRLMPKRRHVSVAAAAESAARRAEHRNLLSWLEVPDSVGWLPSGLMSGVQAARNADVIWATSPSTGGLCLGAILARLCRKPLVVDLRDPWRVESASPYASRFHRRLDRKWEAFVYNTADRIVVVTDWMADMLRKEHPQHAGKLSVLTNGYDPADFPATMPDEPQDDRAFRIGYFGGLYQGREQYFSSFLQAVRQLATRHSGVPIQVCVRGSSHALVLRLAEQCGTAAMVDSGEALPHRQALELMAKMHALLMVGSDHHAYALPGKLFEYLGAGRPLIAITPDGALARFLEHHQVGVAVNAEHGESVESALCRLKEQQSFYCANSARVAARFTREALTGELAELLATVCQDRNPS